MKLKLNSLKDALINFLKGQAVKLALKKFLGSAVAGGFKAWLVKFIVKELYDEIAEPLIKMGINHVGYIYDKQKGKIQVKLIERAKDENNHEDYRNTVNDVFTR